MKNYLFLPGDIYDHGDDGCSYQCGCCEHREAKIKEKEATSFPIYLNSSLSNNLYDTRITSLSVTVSRED
jgi:hypothetical protein